MGKEQDLLQAVKSGDLLSTQKLLSKLKTNRNSKCFYSEIWPISGADSLFMFVWIHSSLTS